MTHQLALATSDWRTRLGIALIAIVALFGATFALRGADAAPSPHDPLSAAGPVIAQVQIPGEFVIRHVDIDQGSVHSTGNHLGVLGSVVDDNDDATSSRHVVCIFQLDGQLGLPLMDGEQYYVDGGAALNDVATWHIVPTAQNPDVNPVPGKISGNDLSELGGIDIGDIPCYAWASANVGDQAISVTLVLDEAVEFVIRYDGVGGSQPLIKEWNTIDETAIVAVQGDLGPDNFAQNTGEFDSWSQRDSSYWMRENLDGTSHTVTGTLIHQGPNTGKILAPHKGFLEYAFGSHAAYEGPIDGVLQTFKHTGTCGTIRVENPQTGEFAHQVGLSTYYFLEPGDSITLINSDLGVGFVFYPNDEADEVTTVWNADCTPGQTTSVLITSREQFQLKSLIDTAPDETVEVVWDAAPTYPKQPVLAWAGMRVALEHDWSVGEECPYDLIAENTFWVLYSKQANPGSPGSFVSDGAYANDYIAFTNENVIVQTHAGGSRQNDPNAECVSSALIESQDPGEFDGTAVVIAPFANIFEPRNDISQVAAAGITLADATPVSGTVSFLVYFMKFESLQLSIVAGERRGHNDGAFLDGNPYNPGTDTLTATTNVSADVLIRARVKGWFTNSNLSGRPEVIDGANSKPAHRWVMPDDWPVLAGGVLANTLRPNYDTMVSPLGGIASIADCISFGWDCDTLSIPGVGGPEIAQFPFVGPFSLVDGPLGNDSKAPAVLGGGYRETWGADGLINSDDAQMPPALITFNLTGSGFLKAASKWADVYWAGDNPFYATHIPAEPWINPINPRGGQFLWDSYSVNGVGPNTGPYEFWEAVAKGPAVYSAGGADGNKTANGANKVATGGYTWIATYSDNHGESMVWLNGDAGLNMSGCQSGLGPDGVSDEPATVIAINGHLCQNGDLVGSSQVTASADYPDFKKHLPIGSNTVTVNWLWGGHKFLTIEDYPGVDFMKYLVLHLTDRDGYCGGDSDTGNVSPSLHPVLGEHVRFRIDATEFFGLPIEDAALNPVYSELGLQVDVETFDTDVPGNPTIQPVFVNGIDGECQAWILLSNSLFGLTDVKVTAWDPEGTITWDIIVDISDPTPEEFTYNLVFGWNLIVWYGETGAPASVLGDYLGDISAVYGWNAPTQTWEGFFPSLIGVPLGNTLAQLQTGTPYWIYVSNPLGLSFTVIVPDDD